MGGTLAKLLYTCQKIDMRRWIIAILAVALADFLSHAAFASSVPPVQEPRLEYLASLPKATDSCSGLYTYDSVPLKSEKFIFVDNLRKLAFINVDGKEIELKKGKDIVFPGGKKIRAVYEGSGYKVILTVRQIRQDGIEAANLEGTLQVKYGRSSMEFKIHGRAGC